MRTDKFSEDFRIQKSTYENQYYYYVILKCMKRYTIITFTIASMKNKLYTLNGIERCIY